MAKKAKKHLTKRQNRYSIVGSGGGENRGNKEKKRKEKRDEKRNKKI